MNSLAKFLIVMALIAGAAAVISLQQGELVFVLNGTQLRSTAPAAISLFILYTLAVIALTRICTFLFGSRPKSKAPESLSAPVQPARPIAPPEPRFVVMPLPLDAVPPQDQDDE